jgi:hypothetical protein
MILIVVPTFAWLCLWQVHRALGGNDLSWAYVFEWPFFAAYAIYMWWRPLHEIPPPGTQPSETLRSSSPSPPDEPDNAADADDADESDRAAYNEYLSELAVRGKRNQWR